MSFPDSSEVAQAIESQESQGAPSGEQAPEAAPSITELDKLEKFKFEGREWTPSDLKKSVLMHQDYTRKTQEFAQERKYYDNLSADLKQVRVNPALAAEFKRLYPEKFHGYLEHVLGQAGNTSAQPDQGSTASSQSKYAQLDPEVVARFERVEANVFNKEVAAIEKELEAQDTEFSSKFPMADVDSCYAKAQSLLDRNKDLPKDQHVELSKEIWERIYKADHEKNQKRYEAVYKDNINKQKQAGLKGKDAGAGGGMPGGSPRTYKSIKEATSAALADLDN